MITIAAFPARLYPGLHRKLKVAHMRETPEEFITKALKISLVFAGVVAAPFLLFAFGKGSKIPLSFVLLFFICIFILLFLFMLRMPDFAIRKRRAEVESDLLYSGRFFLLRMESGQPLINSLAEVSQTSNKSAKYFREIIVDIELGTPIEQAIDHAVLYSPSKVFKKLLEQIKAALRTGADVQESLKAYIDEITEQRIVEIQAYGKKLAPLTLFYMIIGTIVPSLGAAFLVIASSFVEIRVGFGVLMVIAVFLMIIQVFFIMIFKSQRPMVAL
ncbi:MAG TPA: type II secretion system F family protein [Candidatus Nanoarchaeia archaeon]|nr:type II secretion system F family protein [Candidatus Nanoarchaeia archaeon]